jgi:hypothetical protein
MQAGVKCAAVILQLACLHCKKVSDCPRMARFISILLVVKPSDLSRRRDDPGSLT